MQEAVSRQLGLGLGLGLGRQKQNPCQIVCMGMKWNEVLGVPECGEKKIIYTHARGRAALLNNKEG